MNTYIDIYFPLDNNKCLCVIFYRFCFFFLFCSDSTFKLSCYLLVMLSSDTFFKLLLVQHLIYSSRDLCVCVLYAKQRNKKKLNWMKKKIHILKCVLWVFMPLVDRKCCLSRYKHISYIVLLFFFFFVPFYSLPLWIYSNRCLI